MEPGGARRLLTRLGAGESFIRVTVHDLHILHIIRGVFKRIQLSIDFMGEAIIKKNHDLM
ncbi:MAG: hypothetical protein ACYCT2_06260 [Thermoplasmataceae archaeon]